MIIDITIVEGGDWLYNYSISMETLINTYMFPGVHYKVMPAIRFSNGAIYDNVLAEKHYFPWR